MSLDIPPATHTPVSATPITPTQEARRQIEICNACRYCEGYCAVFPAMTQNRAFSDGDISQLANLCHNCRGCYYACQYTEPHEFALNIPKALAEVRVESWENYAWPTGFARLFHRHGVALALALIAGFAVIFALLRTAASPLGNFYDAMPHNLMVALFMPAFLLPLLAVALGLRRFWQDVDGSPIKLPHLRHALTDAAQMRNLGGGQGQGCNFEKTDRYSNARRYLHQAVMWGFLLCFAATSSATILHYGFAIHAPYGLFSLPKLLGLSGGLLLVIGCIGLGWLKTRAEAYLGAAKVWGGEMAFILLLGFTGASGLALYAATGTGLVSPLLALHLGAVLALFLTLPYSKMVHGFFRLASLIRDAQTQDRA